MLLLLIVDDLVVSVVVVVALLERHQQNPWHGHTCLDVQIARKVPVGIGWLPQERLGTESRTPGNC